LGVKFPPPATDYEAWFEENSNAHQRIWLALDENVKQDVLLHAESHTSKLFSALKSLYASQGATAEFNVRCAYEDVKISEYDNFDNYMTTLINAAHQFNKEVVDMNGTIKNRNITM